MMVAAVVLLPQDAGMASSGRPTQDRFARDARIGTAAKARRRALSE
jgi:hypothetical protein